jgi:hypothetical protein
MNSCFRRSVLAIALMAGCAAASAVPITFQYAGNVDFAQFDPAYGGSAPMQIGDRLVFTYTFQSDAAPTSIVPWRTSYGGQGPLLAEVYRSGARIQSWTVPLVDIMLVDNLNTAFAGYVGWDDRYEVRGGLPDAAAGAPLPFVVSSSVGLLKHEFDILTLPTAIQGTALPLFPPDPSVFDSSKLDLSRIAEVPVGGGVFHHFQHWYFQATIDSFGTVPSIPEPSTLLLLGAGLAALAARARLRSSAR